MSKLVVGQYLREPFGEAGVFGGILGVGGEDIFGVGLATHDIESFDIGHGSKEADNGFVGLGVGHGVFGVGGVGVDAELAVNKAFDAGLEAVFETVFAGSNFIIYSAASEIALGEDKGIHFGVNREVILHRTFT